MSEGENILAWLEQTSGARVPIVGTCSIGRLASNTIMLPEERVSRRHALINVQSQQEFWLVDLGSGNGTYLNGRRVVQPTRLRDGDKIEIGGFQLHFHQAATSARPDLPAVIGPSDADKTLRQIKSTDCWLLVADLEDSTQLMHRLPTGDLPLVTGRWLEECKKLIEDCGGSVNKFLGDGFLAYWQPSPLQDEHVARLLEILARLQSTHELAFRFVLHYGQIFLGGTASMGEESLQGKELHFIFRMEKLARAIGERCLLSRAAHARLPAHLKLEAVGSHPVPGFDGEHAFFAPPK